MLIAMIVKQKSDSGYFIQKNLVKNNQVFFYTILVFSILRFFDAWFNDLFFRWLILRRAGEIFDICLKR
jgi:hypothetical protein